MIDCFTAKVSLFVLRASLSNKKVLFLFPRKSHRSVSVLHLDKRFEAKTVDVRRELFLVEIRNSICFVKYSTKRAWNAIETHFKKQTNCPFRSIQ